MRFMMLMIPKGYGATEPGTMPEADGPFIETNEVLGDLAPRRGPDDTACSWNRTHVQ